MKLLTILYFVFVLSIISCDTGRDVSEENEAEVSAMYIKGKSVLRHVVLFNFNDEADEAKVAEIENAFAELPQKISEIKDFEWGVNNSPEGLSKGLTHCFLVTFSTEEDRQVYLPHPDHQAFVKLIGPYVEDVTVVDYWTK